MTRNMGSVDRGIRVLLALTVAGLYLTGRISGLVAIVLIVFAVIWLLTSVVGTCPAYLPFGISTRGGPTKQ